MRQSLVSPVFVGRGDELATVLSAADAAHYELSVVVVGGEAGVGKSRLIGEAAGRLGDTGWRVLEGHCVELGAAGIALAPLLDALRTLAATTSEAKTRAPTRRVSAFQRNFPTRSADCGQPGA